MCLEWCVCCEVGGGGGWKKAKEKASVEQLSLCEQE